jgi:photosystem II stability/assembly factor-like uncharacterized protein
MTTLYVTWICFMLYLCCGGSTVGAEPSPWQAIQIRGYGDGPLDRIQFANDRVGWIIAGAKTVLKTVDGGRTWTVLKTNLDEPGTALAGIWFVDEDRGWAAGTIRQRPAIWQTHDGGTTWATQQTWPRPSADSNGAMLDISFADDTYGWAVGYIGANALIVGTHDGGRHWDTQYAGSEIATQFSRVSVSDRLNVWVLSRDGAVMQARDGGQFWQLRYFNPGLLNAIDALDASNVWVAGAWGHLLHSRNGVAWPQVALSGPLEDHFFGYVKFVSTDFGWAWGTKCDILITHNGGKTWTPEGCPLRSDPMAEITTGEMARSPSKLFMIANPGYILVRSIE